MFIVRLFKLTYRLKEPNSASMYIGHVHIHRVVNIQKENNHNAHSYSLFVKLIVVSLKSTNYLWFTRVAIKYI